MQETFCLGQVEYSAIVDEAEGEHVAEWKCGECQGSGKATAPTAALALNRAKANALVHHAFRHGARKMATPPLPLGSQTQAIGLARREQRSGSAGR